MDLSLDDIIAKTKASKGRGGDRSFKSDGISTRRASGGAGGRREQRSFRSEGGSKGVPSGKWRHDKFGSESRGPVGGGGRSSGAAAPALNLNKKVRVNVSNLANSVTTADLEELFAPFNPDSVVVHYGEGGEHLGTGDVVLKKSEAQKALNDFAGVSVDGSRLKMAIVDGGTGSIYDRVEIKKVAGGGVSKRTSSDFGRQQQQNRPRGGGERRGGENRSAGRGEARNPLDRFDDEEDKPRGGRGGGAGGKRGGGGGKKHLTEEDLDAELDAYMKKN